MSILYISSVCSQARFERLVAEKVITSQFQNQKFHHLLLTGLRSATKDDILVISYYPADRVGSKVRQYDEGTENGINYIYPKLTDIPVIHHLSKFFGTLRQLRKLYRKGDIIVCNIMNFDECRAALWFRRLHPVKVCAIVADVPGLMSGSSKERDAKWKRQLTSLAAPFYRSSNNKYDGYLFLTEAMNVVVNTKGKPFVVMEGIADNRMQKVENTLDGKNPKKTILYAGGLHREYGIQLLVEAFKGIDIPDVELHIYGKGNYVLELEKVAEEDARIKYFGTRSNQEIVSEQVKAHILVNPRPTKEAFVKYSFPSKIMECMASGTPLLTTRIPGMPKDYCPYIYCIDEETVEGVQDALQQLLGKPLEELHKKGQEAKQFILAEKNPDAQGLKLQGLIERVKANRS